QPPRPCEDYWWEWKHCRGLRHAFHHYYAHGELPACGRWRDDYTACRAWERERAAAARVPPGGEGRGGPPAEPGPTRGRGRRGAVWALRSCPPPEWHRPLERGTAG
ncbi:CV039 protein, partial [Odontophorus gujanensis]|nr:CV039 protein [Odontophorus gujanensis]